MSIAEQAQQLQALSEEVPVDGAQELQRRLEGVQQQVVGILGDTASAQELHGQISAVSNETSQLAAGLEQLRLMIVEKATYHQQG
ncbi:hypothetical protein [Saccharopolyspora hattusasensis]|uniref:hypothetical protein n=1 Tax=Saccharopolyspora hattusasensis TaxID=1128679 RepID=UPI003D99222A